MAKISEKIRLIKEHAYFKNKFCVIMLFNSLLLNFALWMLLYFKIKPSNFPIPLHYSIYFGIDNIDYWYKVFLVPGLGIAFLVLNFLLAIWFFNKEKFLAHFLGINNFLVQLILLGGCLPMIFLQNTN